jgi:hypothetical protein
MGDRGALVFGFDAVFPVTFRMHLVNSFGELEAGYLLHFTEEERDPVGGFRIGVAFGARALRRRWLLPGAAFAISYERTFEDEALTLVKVGLRVSLDLAR